MSSSEVQEIKASLVGQTLVHIFGGHRGRPANFPASTLDSITEFRRLPQAMFGFARLRCQRTRTLRAWLAWRYLARWAALTTARVLHGFGGFDGSGSEQAESQ